VCSFFAVEEMNLPSACMLLQDYLRSIQDVIMRKIGRQGQGGAGDRCGSTIKCSGRGGMLFAS
jgi:hypothetical protein